MDGCCVLLYHSCVYVCASEHVYACETHKAAGLWLAAVTLHDVVEGVSFFGDLQGKKNRLTGFSTTFLQLHIRQSKVRLKLKTSTNLPLIV